VRQETLHPPDAIFCVKWVKEYSLDYVEWYYLLVAAAVSALLSVAAYKLAAAALRRFRRRRRRGSANTAAAAGNTNVVRVREKSLLRGENYSCCFSV
jgi:peptidoglycan/LPS O-acetylase OafA/YrhL